ncbi:MAG: FtsX-like permease family protein, partial [Candidatus Latescibacteria bacterium]|nr:FtsX-like permease family protein [Candidatus Latescibacterota bacterium]
MIKGNPKTALQPPHSIVITRKMAEKYFGDEEPMGKIVTYDDKHDFEITGILEDVPLNSHLKFDFLVSFETLNALFLDAGLDKWQKWSSLYTYVLLRKDVSPAELNQHFPDFLIKYLGEGWVESFQIRLRLQPLKRIHLHSHLWGEIEPNNEMKYIYLFSAIAFLILLIACINYMNLSTARYANRAKEVGLRKVLGANRTQLIRQFMGESIFLSFIALLLATALVEFFLPVFSSLIDRKLGIHYSENGVLLLGLIGTALFVGIVSGSYPAFFLSAFQPSEVLKKTVKTGWSRSGLRKMLVVLQFAISIVLIIATIIVYSQLNYIRTKKLGFNKEQVVVIPIRDPSVRQSYESIKEELLQNFNILNATASSYLPGGMKWIRSFQWEGKREDQDNTMGYNCVDHDFIETFEIELVAGRDFSREFTTDAEAAYILNEAAVRKTGW